MRKRRKQYQLASGHLSHYGIGPFADVKNPSFPMIAQTTDDRWT
jgi:hypothetical protein